MLKNKMSKTGKMLLSFVSIISSILIVSCSGRIEYEYIGTYELSGTLSLSDGRLIEQDGYWIRNTKEQLLHICGDSTLSCIEIDDLGRRKIINLLGKNDIIISSIPIKEMLTKTPYTDKDQCPYLKSQVIEVIGDKERIDSGSGDKIFVYTISPKGRYRFTLCP